MSVLFPLALSCRLGVAVFWGASQKNRERSEAAIKAPSGEEKQE